MLYLRAPALTLDASEVLLQSLVQITQPLDLLSNFLLIFYLFFLRLTWFVIP